MTLYVEFKPSEMVSANSRPGGQAYINKLAGTPYLVYAPRINAYADAVLTNKSYAGGNVQVLVETAVPNGNTGSVRFAVQMERHTPGSHVAGVNNWLGQVTISGAVPATMGQHFTFSVTVPAASWPQLLENESFLLRVTRLDVANDAFGNVLLASVKLIEA